MSQTQRVIATNTIQEIANSTTDTVVTVQCKSVSRIGIVVDDRTQADRVLAEDDIYYEIGLSEERTFSGFSGSIYLKTMTTNKRAEVMVLKS
jgi:hypothetical protein